MSLPLSISAAQWRNAKQTQRIYDQIYKFASKINFFRVFAWNHLAQMARLGLETTLFCPLCLRIWIFPIGRCWKWCVLIRSLDPEDELWILRDFNSKVKVKMPQEFLHRERIPLISSILYPKFWGLCCESPETSYIFLYISARHWPFHITKELLLEILQKLILTSS